MPKFYGKIGFATECDETVAGVYQEDYTEREYYGDLLRNNRSLQSADQVNDDITISNEISIVADPYARDHFYAMRYVCFMGAKWKVAKVEVQYPRLILSLGGVFNAKSP